MKLKKQETKKPKEDENTIDEKKINKVVNYIKKLSNYMNKRKKPNEIKTLDKKESKKTKTLDKDEINRIVTYYYYKKFFKDLKEDLSNLQTYLNKARGSLELTREQKKQYRKELIANGVTAEVLKKIGIDDYGIVKFFTVEEAKKLDIPLINIIIGTQKEPEREKEIKKYYDKEIYEMVKESLKLLEKYGNEGYSGMYKSKFNPLVVLRVQGIEEMKRANWNPALFDKLNYSVVLLKELGYTVKDLLYLGYTKEELSKIFNNVDVEDKV